MKTNDINPNLNGESETHKTLSTREMINAVLIESLTSEEKHIKSQSTFRKSIKAKYNVDIQQPEVSRLTQQMHITKEKGYYDYDDSSKIVNDPEFELKYAISKNVTTTSAIHNDFFLLSLNVTEGMENSLCKLLYKKFKSSNELTSIMPGFKSIVIICASEKNAKKIKKYVKASLNILN